MMTSESIRRDLIDLANEQHTFPDRRRAAVIRARNSETPLTWREIANLLDMTEAGLYKAMNSKP